jgi:hypothetical protein
MKLRKNQANLSLLGSLHNVSFQQNIPVLTLLRPDYFVEKLTVCFAWFGLSNSNTTLSCTTVNKECINSLLNCTKLHLEKILSGGNVCTSLKLMSHYFAVWGNIYARMC